MASSKRFTIVSRDNLVTCWTCKEIKRNFSKKSSIIDGIWITQNRSFTTKLKHKIDLNRQIQILSKQKCHPSKLLQVFDEMKQNNLQYDSKTYFLAQQALIKVHCINKDWNAALNVWNTLHNDQYNQFALKLAETHYYHVMSSFLQSNYNDTVLNIFNQMIDNEITPNYKTFNTAISAASKLRSSEKANELYNILSKQQPHLIKSDTFIQNGLINMYLACGDVINAQRIFRSISDKSDTVTWNILINGMIENNKYHESIALFNKMNTDNIPFNYHTYSSITKAISALKLLDKAHSLYEMIQSDSTIDLLQNVALCNGLMQMFCLCDDVDKCVEIWNFIQENKSNILNTKSWNIIMNTHLRYGNYGQVLDLYKELVRRYHFRKRLHNKDKIKPGLKTFLIARSACVVLKDIECGKKVYHDLKDILGTNFRTQFGRSVYYGFIEMYCNFGDINEAINVWKEIMIKPNVNNFNDIIKICIEYGDNVKAFEIFDEMQNEYKLKPTAHTFNRILKACGTHERLVAAMHQRIMSETPNICNNRLVVTALITAYSKCGRKDIVNKVWRNYQQYVQTVESTG